ncbi:hypothetical protein [Roseobacter ponti]|uniref:Lipoprotein n=1 Tax=Roseobacter ponti TaxID=1891787 RepID=A0A858SVA1_9RHOB|nr:hypothetical protein [Roseobacter ponti]QJF52200.1 hypothetical protein G3256_13965 [Roseobacter ponti]
MKHAMKAFVALAATLSLSACASVTNEQRGTITVEGVEYTTLTRTYQQDNRTWTTGDVIVFGRTYGCDTRTPGACERAVTRLRNSDSGRYRDDPGNAASFLIPGV